MDDKATKIKRILKTPTIFNWARLIRPRTDDTCFQLKKLAEGENRLSLRPAYRLCRQMALRDRSYEEVLAKAQGYEGFAQESSVELVECLHKYLIENQVEVVPEFRDRVFRFPLGVGPGGKMLTVPTQPDFVTIRGETLEPTFLLGWADCPFKLPHYQLISEVLRISVLSREDFRGCDARVLTFRRDRWSGNRECRSWRVSQFTGVAADFVHSEVLRYNSALLRAVEEISSE